MRLAPGRTGRNCFLIAVLPLLALSPAGSAANAAAELDISWASGWEADLRGYRLRYGTAPGLVTEAIDLGLATTWTVSGLEPDTTYYITVTAYDQADNESAPSAELMARIPSSLAPIPEIHGVSDTASNSVYAARSLVQLMRFSGWNLQPGAVIALGPDIIVDPTIPDPTGDLLATIKIAGAAALGRRVATVVNPDQGAGSASDVIEVVKNPDGNGDCAVDILDLNALARAWNETRGEDRYAPEADLDGDDYVGPNDLTIFVKFLWHSLGGCP